MSLEFSCGDPSALAGYLYDECELAERRAIEAHLAICTSCAEQVQALRATRAQLASWTPPNRALGFQIVESPPVVVPEPVPMFGRPDRPAKVLRWWQQPLPAWAQAAAAVFIFTSGALVGRAVTPPVVPSGPVAPAVTAQSTGTTPVGTAAVSPDDLTALEERLRAEFKAQADASTHVRPVRAGVSEEQLMQRVGELVAESEQRQQRELAFRTAQVVRDLDSQRQVDLARIERTMGQMEGVTGVEVRQQRQMLNYLLRTAQRQP